jgi:hypothetical protein
MAAAKAPEADATAQLNADIKALVQNGWTLNEQNTPSLEKTYFFKTYTKVAVSMAVPFVMTIANSSGSAPRHCDEEQGKKPPRADDQCRAGAIVYFDQKLTARRLSGP